jgi:hypothetical protein
MVRRRWRDDALEGLTAGLRGHRRARGRDVAGDLIPPPSPAGRPPPDPVAEPAPSRSRFGFAWGALAGLAVCAAGALALLIAAPGESGPRLAANWSPWEPETSEMIEGAQSIADHVGSRYRLRGGEQLVSIRSSALELGGEPIGVAVRPQGGELVFLEGDGLLYILDGLGPGGLLPDTPNRARGRLLMREALELALYSFRYLDDVTMVAVLLPQSAEQPEDDAGGEAAVPETNAIFFRPGDLIEQLEVPLDRTLSPRAPLPGGMTDAEAERVDDLTLRNRFLASVQELRAGTDYLVLLEPDSVD